MRIKVGASLVQYAIILLIMGAVVVTGFFILGGSIRDNFLSYLSFFTNNNETMVEHAKYELIKNDKIVAGSLGGSLNNPVKQCIDDLCVIDFGEFVFSSLPSNMNDFIETSGSAGGSDMLSAQFEKIAEYLQENGDREGAEQYRQLANLGHFMADIQEKIISAAKSCTGVGSTVQDDYNCFEDTMKRNRETIPIPENIASLIPNFRTESEMQKLIERGIILGAAKNDYRAADATRYPSYAMVNLYESIMNNSNYPDSLKAITAELYRNIDDIAFYQAGKAQSGYRRDGSLLNVMQYDAISGDKLGNVGFTLTNGMDDISNTGADIYTDLTSALICVTSGNSDTSNKCHDKNK